MDEIRDSGSLDAEMRGERGEECKASAKYRDVGDVRGSGSLEAVRRGLKAAG